MKHRTHKKLSLRLVPLLAFIAILVSTPFIYKSLKQVPKTQAAWYSSLWGYRVKLTIDDAKVGGANEVFDLGHETGDLTQYSSTTIDGGDLSVTAAAALNGSGYGIQAVIDDTTALIARKNMTKSTQLRYRVYVDPNGVTIGDGDGFTTTVIEQTAGAFDEICSQSLGYTIADGYVYYINCYNDAGTQILSDSVPISDAPHYIEVYAAQATNSSSSDGSYTWWVDGVQQGTAASVDNYNRMFDQDWGAYVYIKNLDVGTSGTIFIDDFVANSDGTEIGPVLTDFPVYIDLSGLPGSFFAHANQTDGRDIRVTKADGTTELAREIVSFDPRTKTGELHIKYTGTLQSSSDTPIFVYYGNATATDYSASDTYGKNNVWDSSYKAVLHLNEQASAVAGVITDSTSNANSFSANATTSRWPTKATAKVSNGQTFVSASAQYLYKDTSVTGFGNMNGTQTLALWYKVSANPVVTQKQFCMEDSTYAIHSCMYMHSSGTIGVGSDWDSPYTQWASTSNPSAGSWHHMVWSWNGTTNRLYVDGAQVTSNTTAPHVSAAIAHLWLGGDGSADSASSKFDGTIDEIQFSTTARSSTWVGTQYNNQNAPSTFFLASAKEEKNQSPVLTLLFDEGTGTTTYDSSANGYTGTLSGATTPSWQTEDQCISGKCLYYNGTTAYTSVATSVPSVQSISFWVRPKTNGETLVDFDGGTHYLSASSGTITATGFSSPTIYVNGVSGGALIANTWQHVEVTTATAFVASALTIGKQSTSFLNGFIDEFKLYDYARTAAQVKSDYAARGSLTSVAARIGPDTGNILSNGLVGYWKMDDAATPSIDSSGNGNTGTWNGNVAAIQGKYGTATSFDGTGDYIDFGSASVVDNLPAISIGVWVMANNDSGRIIDKQLNDNTSGWRVEISSSGDIQFTVDYDGSSDLTVEANSNLAVGVWNHVAISWNGSSSTDGVKIFINGVLQTDLTVNTSGTGNRVDDSARNIGVGCRVSGANVCTSGRMDDMRLYNRALTQAEARQLALWAPGPIGWWNMDENFGSNTVNDVSGNGNTGTISNFTGWKTGKFGGSLEFNNANTVVNVGSATMFDNLKNTGMTAEAWIYPHSSNANGSRIFDKSSAAATNRWIFSITGSASALTFQHTCTPTSDLIVTTNNILTMNSWNHVAVSWTGSTAGTSVTFYLNGMRVASSSITDCVSSLADDSANNLAIGDTNATGTRRPFDGYIDEAKIYNYVRNPSQIIEDMNGGHPAPGSPVESSVAHWKLDEAYGTTAYDSTSNNLALTLSAASWSSNGKYQNSWDGDGAKWISISDANTSGKLDFAAAEDFTVSMWMKSDSPTNPVSTEYLLSKAEASAGYRIFVENDGTGSVSFGIDDDTSWTPGDKANSVIDVYDGTWHNVVAVKQGISKIQLYVDGILKQEDTSIIETGTLENSITMYLGDRNGANGGDEFFGDLDEVKIFRSALTVDQIQILYNQSQSIVLGALSTASDGITASNSAARSYCVPGDTATCNPPIAIWKFDENTGTTANDSSGNGYSGTLTNSPKWSSGKSGGGINTNSPSAYINIGDPASGDLDFNTTDDFTISAWIRTSSTLPSNGEILYKGFGGSDPGYRFRLASSTGYFNCEIADNAAGTTQLSSSGPALNDGRWHYVACVLSASGTQLTVYVDGIQKNTVADSEGPLLSAKSLEIGRNSGTSYFPGDIDDVRIYRYARTQAQIAWDYNRGGPVAWYKFDECTGSTAYNSAPTGSGLAAGNNGTITIGATGTYTSVGTCGSGVSTESRNAGTTGKFGSSLAFDGTNDYITLSDTASPAPSTGLTVAAWINVDSLVNGTNYTIFAKQTWASKLGFRLSLNGTGGCANLNCLFIGVGDGVNQTETVSSGINMTDVGNWHHVVGTFSSGNIALYVDGKQRYTTTSSVTSIVNDAVAGRIGRHSNGNEYFPGKLDDVRVYTYALTPTQVLTLMNEGSAVRFGP